jgi:hypothetical protein
MRLKSSSVFRLRAAENRIPPALLTQIHRDDSVEFYSDGYLLSLGESPR